MSCMNRPTTAGLERNNCVRSAVVLLDTFEVAVGSDAGCSSGVGDGAEGGVISSAATKGACTAARAAALSALAFAFIIFARFFSLYALWSKTPSEEVG